MLILKKSFGIGQQRGCANANAKSKANVKKKTTNETQRKRRSKERKGWEADKKLRGEG